MPKFQKILVSIGLPVYNGEPFIQQAIDSLLAQDYKNFELIISDNGSIDSTQEICMEYAKQDKRIRYYRSDTNNGALWNFNHVFELSIAEYFMWASHDDYWEPSYISVCLKAYERSPGIVLAGTFCESFYPKGKRKNFIDYGLTTIGLSALERFKIYKSTIHSGNHIGGIFYGIYKSKFLSKVQPFNNVIANDHIILAELCLLGEFVTVEQVLVHKRWGGASMSHRANAYAQNINNEFMIRFPYLVREFFFQKMILRTSNLELTEKIRLSLWSLWKYSFIMNGFIYSVLLFLKRNFQKFLSGYLQ